MTKALYKDKYFENRDGSDLKRQKAMHQEFEWIANLDIGTVNRICDIGCAQGEFIVHWDQDIEYYGMEVNKDAIHNAEKRGVRFNKNILTENNFFDLVIFRGTIQHIDEPFKYIEASYRALRPGGMIVFLATPNIGSICFRIFQDLPMLDNELNLYLPSEENLKSILRLYNFTDFKIERPYLLSPYCAFFSDHLKFIFSIFIRPNKVNFAFWGNSINLAAKK